MTEGFDVIVIGASVGGLAAAGLLAKGGARVLLLEDQLAAPEPRGALFALDPVMIRDLKLAQRGLLFLRRDLALVGWDEEQAPLTLSRDRRATARALARVGAADAQAWGPFQALLKARARALRRWWESPYQGGAAEDMLLLPGARAAFAQECQMGAADFLARHFESPRLIGTLLQDALMGGFAPCEPGSALALVWRAAQRMDDRMGACAVAAPASLIGALKRSYGGEIRMGARVREIVVSRGKVAGVVLADGETIAARIILSSLPCAASERLAGLERPEPESGVGEAQLIFSLADGFVLPPSLEGARAIAAASPQDAADAHEAARAGRLPPVPSLTVVAENPHRLVVTLPLAPLAPLEGWPALKAPFAAASIKRLARSIPGLGAALTAVTVMRPRRQPRASLAQLLAPAAARAATKLDGLYLCGDDAEPVPCVSGRAGRFAAHFALRALQQADTRA